MRLIRITTPWLVASSFFVSHGFAPFFHHRRHISSAGKSPFISFSSSGGTGEKLQQGDAVQIEVVSFGPLGASVEVVGIGHNPDDLIPETDHSLGRGLVLQREISYFRQARNNVDVVVGEVLPAYVETIRDDGRLNISLRPIGGKAKAENVSKQIIDRLERTPGYVLNVGDKSPPEAIAEEFPGVSKVAFKKAVSALYKQGKVTPGPFSISLTEKDPTSN
jgi:hypothetical protein